MAKYEDTNIDNLNIRNMWKEFGKIGNKRARKHTAKIDHKSNEITDENEITNLLSKEITERLRVKPSRMEYEELDKIENELYDIWLVEKIQIIELIRI